MDAESDGLGAPNCPVDLVPMQVAGEDLAGADAHWACPVCGLVSVAG